MLGLTSLPSEDRSLALQVETDEAAPTPDAATGRGIRFLGTELGFAVLMLIGGTCVLLPPSPHATPSRLNPEVVAASFLPSLPGVQQNQQKALSPSMPVRSSRREAFKQQAQTGVALAALAAMTPQSARADTGQESALISSLLARSKENEEKNARAVRDETIKNGLGGQFGPFSKDASVMKPDGTFEMIRISALERYKDNKWIVTGRAGLDEWVPGYDAAAAVAAEAKKKAVAAEAKKEAVDAVGKFLGVF